MAIFNQAIVDGAHVVARAIEYQVRQATSDVLSSTMTGPTSPTSVASSSITPFPSPSSATGNPPQPTTMTGSDDQSSGGDNNTGTSSPLLFFVALGFGVVFTNLWIIVGVKYCFRYNARNRQMRGLDENGEPINLENMPTRPHRRRREKKLMTMDEVNDKFPMMKYKSWVSDRAREGLPTAGGVSAPASRANSVRSVEGIVPELQSKERDSTDEHPDTAAAPTPADKNKPNTNTDNTDRTPDAGAAADGTTLTQAQTAQTMMSTMTKDDQQRASMDDDDDEHINAALPPELMGTAGDTCAICIDSLEDDDDVRGLTCGHAFHAVCLDPWLTNRRACCPLCKADYYTPKPRPPPADGDPNNPNSPNATDPSRNNSRMNLPRSPQRTFTSWSNFRGTPRVIMPGRFGGGMGSERRNHGRQPRIWDRQRPERPHHRQTETQSQPSPPQGEGWMSRVRGRINQLGRRNQEDQAAAATPGVTTSGANGGTTANNTTPSQLEAGVRPAATTTN